MPQNQDEMEKYEMMLDELASSYPELEGAALDLKDEMLELDTPEDPDMEDMEMEGEEPDMPADFPEMEEDLELEDEEDLDEEDDEMAGFPKY